MSTKAVAQRDALQDAVTLIKTQYGCGPVQFAGTDEALYERHLLFDNSVALEAATARDRFEALARSVRDILSQRWPLTERNLECASVSSAKERVNAGIRAADYAASAANPKAAQ